MSVTVSNLDSIRATVADAYGVSVYCEVSGPGGFATLSADTSGNERKAKRVATAMTRELTRIGLVGCKAFVCSDGNVRCSVIGFTVN